MLSATRSAAWRWASPRSAAARSARSTAAGFGAIGLLSAIIPGQIADQARAGKLPPVVIVHGADDQAISPRGAEALAAGAVAGGVPHELEVIPGQGHEWTGERAQQAADTLGTFLARHLAELQVGQRP